MKIGVSACLLGINCRYDGKNSYNEKVKKFLEDKDFFVFCPEQLGGLSTPRMPSEIIDYSKEIVKNKNGEDVSENFKKGAEESIKIIEMLKPDTLILKEKSPSCGVKKIYDGTFSGTLKEGNGILSKYLREKKLKIKIISDEDF
jgi:uncharacterized protein YbbK (DUF523 family)